MRQILNISFISSAAKQLMREEIDRNNAKLERVRRVLSGAGEATLAQAKEYQEQGADYKRKAVMQECEEYISRTGMPEYLQNDARNRAWESCPNDYIDDVKSCLSGLGLKFGKDVSEVNGKWVIAKPVEEEIVAKYTTILSDDEMADLAIFKQILDLAEKLHEKYYFISPLTDGYYDELYKSETDQELAERFLFYRRATPEERKQRGF